MKGKNIVLTNASIWGQEEYDTIIIKNGKIIDICNSSDLSHLSSNFPVIDLEGRLVIPGLADAHMHLYGYALSLMRLDLRGTMSIEELKEKVYKFSLHEKSKWIIGRGWDQENFKEKRYPTRWDLDDVVPDKPVVLTRVCGHVLVANSIALKIAGIHKGMSDPLGGIIGRENDGEPNGLLFEKAMDLVYSKIPPLSFSERKKAIYKALKEALSYGLTELHVMSVSSEELGFYRKIFQNIFSPIRIKLFLEYSLARRIGRKEKLSYNVDIFGIKMFADGSLGGRTAALRKPYTDDKMNYGMLTITENEILEGLDLSVKSGLQLAIHAIGDKAIEFVINNIEKYFKGKYVGKRVRIEHVSLLMPDLLDRIKRLGLGVSVQPHFILTDWWVVDRLGNRAKWVYPLKSIVESDILAVASSDAPVEPLNPWLGIYAAVDRGRNEYLDIWSVSPNEALSVDEALRLYINGKILSGTFNTDKIVKGMVADLVVLDMEQLSRNIKKISDTQIYMTLVDGKIVYQKELL